MRATLLDKVWDEHVVADLGNNVYLLHVDRHLLHDLGGPRGMLDIKEKGYRNRNPEMTFATPDHSDSSAPGRGDDSSPVSGKQVRGLRELSREFGVTLFDLDQEGQGIVHVIGPELGLTLPGVLLVCGDSHTCTHGALGALAWGIGSTELSHVLATQTIVQRKPKRMRVTFDGQMQPGVQPKDLILYLIGQISAAGGAGYAIEYAGSAIRDMSIEGRMTVCNLSIELGAKVAWWRPTRPPSTMSRAAASPRRAPNGTWRWRIGRRCAAMTTPSSTARSRSMSIGSGRRSPGVPARKT